MPCNSPTDAVNQWGPSTVLGSSPTLRKEMWEKAVILHCLYRKSLEFQRWHWTKPKFRLTLAAITRQAWHSCILPGNTDISLWINPGRPQVLNAGFQVSFPFLTAIFSAIFGASIRPHIQPEVADCLSSAWIVPLLCWRRFDYLTAQCSCIEYQGRPRQSNC